MDVAASSSPAKPTNNEHRTPIYAVYKLDDGSLFWFPPKRSPELAEALKHHFPYTKGSKYRMLEAIARFNQDIRSGAGLRPREAEWELFGGRPQGLEQEKKESFLNGQTICYGDGKIQALSIRIPNRGMACSYHRSTKTQCNPRTCYGNKMFQPSAAREIEPEIRNTSTSERESSISQSKPYTFSFKDSPPRLLDCPSEITYSQSPDIGPSNYVLVQNHLAREIRGHNLSMVTLARKMTRTLVIATQQGTVKMIAIPDDTETIGSLSMIPMIPQHPSMVVILSLVADSRNLMEVTTRLAGACHHHRQTIRILQLLTTTTTSVEAPSRHRALFLLAFMSIRITRKPLMKLFFGLVIFTLLMGPYMKAISVMMAKLTF